jgi:hypothetical protein
MKPLSELVKEWRELKAVPTICQCCHGNCADSLQAWLREADEWVDRNTYLAVGISGQIDSKDILRDLLGTTQPEGER